MLIASSNSRFADTVPVVAIMPGWGLSHKLPRIIRASRAREMSLSGRFVDAQTACSTRRWNLRRRSLQSTRSSLATICS